MSIAAPASRHTLVSVAVRLACPLLMLAGSQTALAQSSGTAAAEGLQEVLISAKRIVTLGGVSEQSAPKSRVTLSGEAIMKANPGNTFLDALNQVPGLNFTNNDPYGTSGGNLRLRSFDGNRISLTFDGIPLNDTGNYAVYSNQLIDPELIESVDVNLGTTDVDSPTASATGGTINSRTRKPYKDMTVTGALSLGQYSFSRLFGSFDTGSFGPLGTRAYISASGASNNKFKGPGELKKVQLNGRIYQEFDNGDFISLAAHFNRNRNNFYRNASDAAFQTYGRAYDNNASCLRDAPTAGVKDDDGANPNASTGTLLNSDNPLNPGACSNYYGVRINPSDTGNLRITSLWHLTDKLRLTVDPSFQYVMANGGGSTVIAETDARVLGASGLKGFDLNGDGDTLDSIRYYTPSNTNTRRYGVNSSLLWDLAPGQLVRLAYTLDYGRHRQTGEYGFLDENGNPLNVFAGRYGDKVYTADRSFLRTRDRFSIAQLSQFALDYRGKFMGDSLTLNLGVRSPQFKRELNQYCYSQNGTSSVLCTTQPIASTLASGNVTFGTSTTQYIAPYAAEVKYNKVLPNLGVSYDLTNTQSVYASYSKGLSVPRTDSLYTVKRALDNSIARANPEPEETQSYDLGWRYKSSNFLANAALWQSKYKNRIVTAFDQDLGISVDRNIGDVDLKGADLQVAWQPTSWMLLNASASYVKTELLKDLAISATVTLPTGGKELVETPKTTYGARAEFYPMRNLAVGIQGKMVGKRFSTDVNDAFTSPYKVFDLDARYNLEISGMKNVSVRLNVSNLFDEQYYGSISSGSNALPVGAYTSTNLPFYYIGSPRTVSGTLMVQF